MRPASTRSSAPVTDAARGSFGIEQLDADAVDRTLGSVLKYSEDQEVIRAAGLEQLVGADD